MCIFWDNIRGIECDEGNKLEWDQVKGVKGERKKVEGKVDLW